MWDGLQGSNPKMTAKTNCRYEIEWVTEYACHRDYLESHSCTLTSEQHDISIDLRHLTHPSESSGAPPAQPTSPPLFPVWSIRFQTSLFMNGSLC